MAIWYPGEYANLILDSKLITPVRDKIYDVKLVVCGDYVQCYYYPDKRTVRKENIEKLDIYDLKKKTRIRFENKERKIEDRNIIRTKLSCQRLAKANASVWKSFITLTYRDNMQDVAQSKKDLEYFITNIKKIKKDFKYISIPEFQKRGAIHFHLLTNLSPDDDKIIIPQRTNTNYYDVKYWSKGFTSFESVAGDIKKIVGYISKYMTKDNCDERLFNFRRFSSSQNLIKPEVTYINLRTRNDIKYFVNVFKGREKIYTNEYEDNQGNYVTFDEYLKTDDKN